MFEALADAHAWCDEQDKSTEFMIQYLCDAAQVEDHSLSYEDAHEVVIGYLTSQ